MFFQLWPTAQGIVEHQKMWQTSNITRMFLKLWPTAKGIVEQPEVWTASQGIKYEKCHKNSSTDVSTTL